MLTRFAWRHEGLLVLLVTSALLTTFLTTAAYVR